jgi:hypothetical protein
VVLMTVGSEAEPAPEEIDILWPVASAAEVTVESIRALLAEIGERP